MQSKQCLKCKHYLGAGYCQAFLEGIPGEIMTGQISHAESYPGDNGIQFELDEEFQKYEEPSDR